MNNIMICKTCIWFDDLACRNNQRICIDNREYIDSAEVIRNISAEENKEEDIEIPF